MEPAGGFERSICRLQFGRFAIKLHRRKSGLLSLETTPDVNTGPLLRFSAFQHPAPAVPSTNEHLEEAQAVLDGAFRRKGYRGPLTSGEWNGCREINNAFSVRHNSRTIVTLVVMRDPPKRVRLLLSATVDRGELGAITSLER